MRLCYEIGGTGLKFLRQIGFSSAMMVLAPSVAPWVLPHEIVDHPAFLPALVAVLFAAVLFAYHLFRLRRVNFELQALAEERIAAVTSLQETEARYMASERIARIGNWERHLDSGVIHWSDQAYAVYGLDPATYTPTFEDIFGRMHPDDRESVRSAARDALKCQPGLKVILTSGNWDLASPNGMPFLEGAAVLPKPYTEENLADIIRRALGKPLSLPERQSVES